MPVWHRIAELRELIRVFAELRSFCSSNSFSARPPNKVIGGVWDSNPADGCVMHVWWLIMQSTAATVVEYLSELPPHRAAAIIRSNVQLGFEKGMHYGMIAW